MHTEQEEMKPRIAHLAKFLAYSLFLLLPIVTLVLLQTTPWHQNNSECDPYTPTYVVGSSGRYEYRNGKCTCLVEYPRYMYILACFELLVFVYFCVSDPITNTPFSTIRAACKSPCSPRLMFILIFDISYLTLNGLAFSALVQSNPSCGTALVGWTSMTFALRIVFVIFFNLPPLRVPMFRKTKVLSIQYGNLYTAVQTRGPIEIAAR